MKTHHHHKHWEVGMSLSGSPTDMNEVGRGYLTWDIFRIQSFSQNFGILVVSGLQPNIFVEI